MNQTDGDLFFSLPIRNKKQVHKTGPIIFRSSSKSQKGSSPTLQVKYKTFQYKTTGLHYHLTKCPHDFYTQHLLEMLKDYLSLKKTALILVNTKTANPYG